MQRVLACFASFGYAQVSPPLLEFETSLLSGRGQALSSQTFRVMDPASQEMMGFRADMTLQVARIATTRLGAAPRPLRLCYGGPILRIKPDALKNERQLLQAGIELIGSDALEADAEVMIVAAEALNLLGIDEISIDINLPGLLSELCPEAANDIKLRTTIGDALQRRDATLIASLPVKNNTLLASLLDIAGPANKALPQLEKLGITHAKALAQVSARVQQNCPQLSLTIDPLEYRGFDYHTGIGFSIFAKGLRHELGRGGRYMAAGETATGFTLYVTHLLGLVKTTQENKPVLISLDTDIATARKLRGEGWATITALTKDLQKEAKALGIVHIWQNGKIISH